MTKNIIKEESTATDGLNIDDNDSPRDTSSGNDDSTGVKVEAPPSFGSKDKDQFVKILSALSTEDREQIYRQASVNDDVDDEVTVESVDAEAKAEAEDSYEAYRNSQGYDTFGDSGYHQGPAGNSGYFGNHGSSGTISRNPISGGNPGLGLGRNGPALGLGGPIDTVFGGSNTSSRGSGGSGSARMSNAKNGNTRGNSSNNAGAKGRGSGVTSRNPNILTSGFQVRPASRTEFEISKTEVQISKIGRGSTPQERLKTRKLVVRALSPKLSVCDITTLTNMSEVDNYDISKDAHMQEHALLAVGKFAQTFDMMGIFMIPNHFTLHDPSSTGLATRMTNILDDWKDVNEVDVFAWQEFILRFGSSEDLESNNWMEDTLYLSMEQSLKSEVLSDVQDVPKLQRGAVTLFYLVVKRVFLRNQEARDLLITWIKEFDLLNFPNQNVSKACLAFKAIVRSVGEKDLPSNTVRCLLTGMSNATNANFKQVCATNEAMLSNSLYQRQLGTLTTVDHLKAVMTDLERKYLELCGGKKWEGIGHEPVAFFAGDKEELGKARSEYDGHARALAARGEKPLPFNEWVKTAFCHGCGKQGHIKPDCPELLRQKLRDGRRGDNPLKKNNRWSSKGTSDRRGKKDRAFRKEFKALCAKFGEPCDDSESEAEDDKDEASVESSTEHEGNEDEESPSANLAGLYLNE